MVFSPFSQVTSDKTRGNDSGCAKRGAGWIKVKKFFIEEQLTIGTGSSVSGGFTMPGGV